MEDFYRLEQPYCIKIYYQSGYIILNRNYDKLKKSGRLEGNFLIFYLYDDSSKPWSSLKNCNDYHLKLKKELKRIERCIHCNFYNIDLKCKDCWCSRDIF